MNTIETFEQQILTRYAMFDRPLSGEKNVIVDSFFPAYYLKKFKNNIYEEFPVTAAAISEFAADVMQVPLVPRQDLIEMLGYKISDIKRLLLDVKRKSLTLHMIGLGGTNSNTLYWLLEFCKLTNTPNLFDQLVIQENDRLSIDNMLRMPMSPLRHIQPLVYPRPVYQLDSLLLLAQQEIGYCQYNKMTPEQIRLAHQHIMNASSHSFQKHISKLLDKKHQISKLGLVTTNHQYLSVKRLKLSFYYYHSNDNHLCLEYPTRPNYHTIPINTIFYGAPDIATRQEMAATGKMLITATHGDNDATLSLNPSQDSTLQVETYGVIRLGPFFMNQIRLAIGLLETLASDQDLHEQNKTLLDYSYTDANSKCARTWKVQQLHDGLLRSTI